MRWWTWALFLLLVSIHVGRLDSKKGGRGGSRGRSGSRTNSGRTNTGRTNTGRTNTNTGRSNTGRTGTKSKGVGSKIKSALGNRKVQAGIAAAAAGYLTYKAGKAILKAGSHYAMFGNRRYYWGDDYYNRYGDTSLNNIFLPGGSQPVKTVVFSCPMYQVCCGMDCCPGSGGGGYGGGGGGYGMRQNRMSWWPALLVGLLFLLCCCGGFFVLYKFFRHLLNCVLGPANGSGGENKDFDNVADNSVPMQPANYPTYAPQQNPYTAGYPPAQQNFAPSPQQSYAQAPPPYGFNT